VPCASFNSVPIVVKLSAFGLDQELQLYTNSTVEALITKLGEISSMDSNSLKVKVVEET